MSHSPEVWTNPGFSFGEPCTANRRIPVETIAGAVRAGDSVDAVAAEFDLTRGDVLVACWYAARHIPRWRRRPEWRAWVESREVEFALWHVDTVDYDAVPDPPTAAAP